MSDTLANLRRKIDGAKTLQSVVRTMKAVAASSIGQYESAIRALSDYERSVELGLSVCFRSSGIARSPSGTGRKSRIAGAIVFGSDQGLVGQFNEILTDFVKDSLEEHPGQRKIWAIGERVAGSLVDAGLPLTDHFSVPTSVKGITSLVGQLQMAVEAGGSECSVIEVFYTKLVTGALHEPVRRRLLPLNDHWQKDLVKVPWPTKNLPQLFGDNESTMRAFVREYLFITLYKACAESLASENASRLASMQRAEKNINSVATDLNRKFYRLRQSSIDEELFDVIAGFNALSAKRPGSHTKAFASHPDATDQRFPS